MIEDWHPQEGDTVKYKPPGSEGFQYEIGVIHQIVETPHDNLPFCIRPQEDEDGRVWCPHEGIHPTNLPWIGYGDKPPRAAPEPPEEVEPVITVQIEAVPESESYQPSILALQSDGTIWTVALGTGEWKKIHSPPQPPYH